MIKIALEQFNLQSRGYTSIDTESYDFCGLNYVIVDSNEYSILLAASFTWQYAKRKISFLD
jgi:hypothetical protein